MDSAGESVAVLGSFFPLNFRPDDNRPSPHLPSHHCYIPDLMITPTMVRARLEKILVNKSIGPGGVHSQPMKPLAPVIEEPLPVNFKPSLESVVKSNDRSRAHVTPIHKKG